MNCIISCGFSESGLLNASESVVNVFSEGSELSLEETNGLGNDFLISISLITSFGILDVFIITVLELLVVLLLLLLGSVVLFLLLVGGVGDSLVEGGNFGFEVTDLSLNFVELGGDSGTGGVVFGNPMLISSSFNFSGFGNLVQEFITDVDDLFNSLSVSLDGGSSGDLRE